MRQCQSNNLASDQGQSVNHDSTGSGQLTGSAAALAAVVVTAWANLTQTGEGNLAPRLTWWLLQAKPGTPLPPMGGGRFPFLDLCQLGLLPLSAARRVASLSPVLIVILRDRLLSHHGRGMMNRKKNSNVLELHGPSLRSTERV